MSHELGPYDLDLTTAGGERVCLTAAAAAGRRIAELKVEDASGRWAVAVITGPDSRRLADALDGLAHAYGFPRGGTA
jgi:hypothetical protein